jgi:hypothetical protein
MGIRLVRLNIGRLLLLTACVVEPLTAQEEPPVVFGTTVVIPSGLRGLVYYIKHNRTELPDFENGSPSTTTEDFGFRSPAVTGLICSPTMAPSFISTIR